MTRVQPIRDRELLQRMKEFLKEKNQRDFILFLIGIHTGLRISDILKLKVADVQGWNIILNEQKTKKYNEIKMTKELKREMRGFIGDKNKNEYLIKSRKGKSQPITPKRAYEILRELAEEFGLERIGTHSLRKTFGYQHYKKFKDIAKLQAALNHDNPSVTLIYIGIAQDELNDLQGKIDW